MGELQQIKNCMAELILILVLIVLVVVNIWLTNAKLIKMDSLLSRIDPLIRDEFSRNRDESHRSLKDNREELTGSLKSFEEKFSQNVKDFNELQRQKFEDLVKRQEGIRKEVEDKLKEIREDNSKKLEEMRKTVDEKLQESVEKRFNESFKLISDRLEQVHKGLGEMQSLASGVGDLKRVLTNVKTRGNLGEIQLGAILEQILSPEQYEQNAAVDRKSVV